MASAEHLNKVKSKLASMKEKIDQTEDRELEAKEKLRDAEARLEKALADVDSFKRRIQLVEIEAKKTKEALEIRTNELEGMQQRTKSEEELCKELEVSDRESDSKINEMEDKVVEGDARDKDAAIKLAENELKFKVTTNELEKAIQKAEQLEERASTLENHLTGCVENMASLEEKDAAACERELEGEEKIEFIQEQLKAMVYRYEEAERKAPPLENYIFQIMEDTDNYKQKQKEIEKEMKLMGELVEEVTGPEKHTTPAARYSDEEEEEEE